MLPFDCLRTIVHHERYCPKQTKTVAPEGSRKAGRLTQKFLNQEHSYQFGSTTETLALLTKVMLGRHSDSMFPFADHATLQA